MCAFECTHYRTTGAHICRECVHDFLCFQMCAKTFHSLNTDRIKKASVLPNMSTPGDLGSRTFKRESHLHCDALVLQTRPLCALFCQMCARPSNVCTRNPFAHISTQRTHSKGRKCTHFDNCSQMCANFTSVIAHIAACCTHFMFAVAHISQMIRTHFDNQSHTFVQLYAHIWLSYFCTQCVQSARINSVSVRVISSS